jgi:hypothetical protein
MFSEFRSLPKGWCDGESRFIYNAESHVGMHGQSEALFVATGNSAALIALV